MPQQYSLSKPKRPWPVTLLVLIVLLVAGIQLMKFTMAIQQWDMIENTLTLVSPLFLTLTGSGWGLISIALGWGLWLGKSWARFGIQIAGVLYVLAIWIDLLWIAAPDLMQTRWPFSLGLSILGLGSLFASVYCPVSKLFFTELRN